MNQGVDPHAPESQPTRQGRRLIRMLFRSGADEKTLDSEKKEQDNRTEDNSSWRNPSNNEENMVKPAPAPVTSKFASLKRKLFPSQNRRYPRNVPPLISPISASVKASLTPLINNGKSPNSKLIPRGEGDNNDQNQINSRDDEMLKPLESDNREDSPESDVLVEGVNNSRTTGSRTLIDDDDDRDLENAVEALDFESSMADNTLEEMNKAIDDLRAWKEAHELATQEALHSLEAHQQFQPLTIDTPEELIPWEDPLELQLELKIQQQYKDREAQTLELRKEAEAYQLECSLFKTSLDESEAARVDQALQGSTDSEGLALSRLRSELFQLDVKQRQDALLQELQGADSALDMNIIDVQAFTGELDAVLAQFDRPSIENIDKVEDEDLKTKI